LHLVGYILEYIFCTFGLTEEEATEFTREVDENCPLLPYYATSSGTSLPTFPDNLIGSRLKLIGRPETSVRNCHYSLRNDPEERSSNAHMCLVSTCGVIPEILVDNQIDAQFLL